MKNIYSTLLILLIASSAFAKTITSADNEKTIHLQVGEELHVVLPKQTFFHHDVSLNDEDKSNGTFRHQHDFPATADQYLNNNDDVSDISHQEDEGSVISVSFEGLYNDSVLEMKTIDVDYGRYSLQDKTSFIVKNLGETDLNYVVTKSYSNRISNRPSSSLISRQPLSFHIVVE